MNLKDEFYRLLLKIFYKSKYNIKVKYENFDPKRRDPYVLIGNHQSTHDGILATIYLKKPPVPTVATMIFLNPTMRFFLTKVYKAIPILKGQTEITTVRSMMKAIDKGKAVMIFPEAKASYYGANHDFVPGTSKFVKKMELDLVSFEIRGAYLTSPRWGEKNTKHGLIEITYKTLIKGEDMKNHTNEEVYEVLAKAIPYNDFDWNRERQYDYKPKNRALGLEKVIYVCPKCNGLKTISTKGNTIRCSNCGEIAHFNDKCFLEGLQFDNLVDWSKLQQKEIPRIAKEILYTYGKMYEVDTNKFTTFEIGDVDIELIEKGLYVQHRFQEYSFDLDLMKGLALTLKDGVSFDYLDKTYMFKIKDPMLFYDVIKYKIGG